MFRRPTAVLGAVILAVATALVPVAASAAPSAEETDEAQAANSALIEIPYGEPGELPVAEGVTVDCGALPAGDGFEITCEPAGITLTVAAYDPAWGERVLPVTLVSGATRTVVNYRVALAPPPAPEITTPRVDAPFAAGSQVLIPLSLLGITCTLCSPGTSSVRVEAVSPDTAHAGVGPTHLAVRSGAPGDVTVELSVEDDAGQIATAEVTVSMVATAPGAAPRALHVGSAPTRSVDLTDLAWGEDLSFSCSATVVGGTCGADGVVSFPAAPLPGDQLSFRVVDGRGHQAVGSVTFTGDAADAVLPVSPMPLDWSQTSPLGISVPAPASDQDDGATVLSRLSRILQEVPTP
ncbi:hypothetical protein J2Y46_001760 [Microbacterium sp. BE35]|uniref:hypothetical protein n=1 Tax=Microbacterium sp. BE35 TaxID=2817773 RepID=UPI00286763DF|nr:hypothetical protein [Microbacterium sp. BE35]MDR7188937.1 hypothetical protein [Microbacterium sp. BE35]